MWATICAVVTIIGQVFKMWTENNAEKKAAMQKKIQEAHNAIASGNASSVNDMFNS